METCNVIIMTKLRRRALAANLNAATGAGLITVRKTRRRSDIEKKNLYNVPENIMAYMHECIQY